MIFSTMQKWGQPTINSGQPVPIGPRPANLTNLMPPVAKPLLPQLPVGYQSRGGAFPSPTHAPAGPAILMPPKKPY